MDDLDDMDLREEHWQKLKPLLLGGDADPGATGRDNRLFLRAIFWVVDNGSKWSALPPEFGRWQTAYVRFMRWNQAGIWRRLADELADDRDLHGMLSRVVAFGDTYTRRATQRLKNKSSREAYLSMLGKTTEPRLHASSEEIMLENIGSSWIWLLTRK
ncbi:transposase [Collimonas sp. OK412]|jgi:transposase|uniref:transposase n=1 Tax=Collimonas sp. (strain OK412) TaxID=1801619 RepID=UPI0008E38213|nr:transposase [Collimonas sp. OK412]SFD10626.1 Transposase [Collimonas sp. OK412]